MPYKPLIGGSIYNGKIAKAKSINSQVRGVIEKITEGNISQAELYQYLTAITLLTVRSDDVLSDLSNFDR
jgi:hypothetical protein